MHKVLLPWDFARDCVVVVGRLSVCCGETTLLFLQDTGKTRRNQNEAKNNNAQHIPNIIRYRIIRGLVAAKAAR
jgi:hypothetical protein